MKADIITRHSVANYGSLLQTYATQKIIEKLGIECEIIDYYRYDERPNELAKSLLKGKEKWDKNFFTRLIYKIIMGPNYKIAVKKFDKYRKNFIKVSNEKYGNIEEIKKNPPKADIYISGGDQIWGRIGASNYDEAFFLNFLPDDARRIAFSSSFGKTELNNELKDNIKKLMSKYETILVREDSAKKLLNEYGFNNVNQVLDPTFLLEKADWIKISNKKLKTPKKYILVYQLHHNKEFSEYAKKVAKKLNMKIIRISTSIVTFFEGGNFVYLPKISDFITYFNNASLILTDSFHATAFSIILNKNFIEVLPNSTRTRIESLLRVFNLEERILNSYDDFSIFSKYINFSKVNEKIKIEQEKTINLLKNAIIGDTKSIDLLNKHYECCGCRTCEKKCPVKAIEMIENEEGFLEPKIDKNKCINCGLCLRVCPQYNQIKENNPLYVYAAYNKNEDKLLKGSSGSIFIPLAEYVIENNGSVYGVEFDENIKAKHIRITEKKDIINLTKSKYVQSDTMNTYIEVEKDLNEDKLVLYTGTPCQISGLKAYLNKEYENLITADLICHGVPSPGFFRKYIEYIEKKSGKKLKMIEFRNKEKFSWGLNLKKIYDDMTFKITKCRLDPYFQLFQDAKTYREVCYNCKYANTNRIGDITLGDYWGIQKECPEFYGINGVSAVLVNTKKGKETFDVIKDQLQFKETNIEGVKKYNSNLSQPSLRNSKRDIAYKNLYKKDFIKIAKEDFDFKKNLRDIIKSIIPNNIKNTIKKIIQ